ncbi:MAG: tetratricopeptide repeat protein, partial [bacterium]
MNKICDLVIRCCVYGLAFLMPLFWLPWTIEAYEFNKQYLLFFLGILALFVWLFKMVVVEKKIVFKQTPLDIWILVFMVVMVLSSVFSLDKVSSWLGFYGRFSGSVIGLLIMCLMYFVIVNNTDKNILFKKIFSLFLVSSSAVVIIAYLSIFGVWSKIPNLPQVMTFNTFNSVSGSLQGLSIFLAVLISFLVGLIFYRLSKMGARAEKSGLLSSVVINKKKKSSYGLKVPPKADQLLAGKTPYLFPILLLFASLVLMLIIDFWAAWFVLGITMMFLLVIAFWTRAFRDKVNILILPIALIIISSVCSFVSVGEYLPITDESSLVNLPQEIILDYETAGLITWQTLKNSPVLGSGPGTFLINFTKFKPFEFNQTAFWNVRFDRGPSQIMEMVSSTGILGILSYLLVISVFFLVMFWFLRKTKKDVIILCLLLPWFALLIGQCVYSGNTTLNFYFWFFLALGIANWKKTQVSSKKEIVFSFEKMPEVGLVFNVILLILGFVLIGLFYLGGSFYIADVMFQKLAVDNQGFIKNLEKAVNLNKYREGYKRSLSQAYLAYAWSEAEKPTEEQNIELIRGLANGFSQQAKSAVDISPNLVTVWENLGIIYRDSIGLVGGTIPLSLDAFAQASELEPINPFLFRERCRLNLINEERDWDETVEYCQRAIELKQNYLDAHIQLALVYEGKGDLEKAIEQMESVLDKLKGVSFQRGSD